MVEAGDEDTINAIRATHPPAHFEILPVPPGEPRTKPKALNYGLAFARGRLVVVFDAEDRPAPGQLRAAMAAFLRGPANLAVVQAPLQIHNGADSWIARQFDIEYAIHFRVWLPMLARMRWPIALGGTSNYFRRDRLVACGGWDAWNVTEDADIGIRLARFGGVAGTISPPTLEEAPSGFGAWLNQRTRWMKGHLQTWLVLNRRPLRAMADLGLANFLAIQLTLGGSLLASMLHGPLFVWIAADIFVAGNLELWHFGLLGLGYASAVAAAFVSGAVKTGWRSLLLLPLYWPLQSLAMLKALWEIKTRPHFWAKTSHGKARPAARPPLLLPDLRQPVPDNLTQLELPFAPAEDAATLPLGGRM